MKSKKPTYAELERKLQEALAARVQNYCFSSVALDQASKDYLMGSGVILTLTAIGGRNICEPVLIMDGLSNETITALRADLCRSYKVAVELKPKGVE